MHVLKVHEVSAFCPIKACQGKELIVLAITEKISEAGKKRGQLCYEHHLVTPSKPRHSRLPPADYFQQWNKGGCY